MIFSSLPQNINIDFKIFNTKSHDSLFNHVDSQDVVDKPMFSTFDVERAMVACFFESQMIRLIHRLRIKFIVDQLSVKSLAESVST